MVTASKVLILKPGEFKIWRMKIKQYIQIMDYALWEVIENGVTLPQTQVVEGVTTMMPITSVEDKPQRRLEVKATSTLMMAIPNEHQLKFNSIKDTKQLQKLLKRDLSDQAKDGPNYALIAFTSSSSDIKIVDNYKKGLGYESYNTVPPPYIGNFMPPNPNLFYTGLDEFLNKPVAENNKSCKVKTKIVRKNSDALIIKKWVSDDEDENVTQPKIIKKTVKPNIVKKEFVKPRQQIKTHRKTVKKVKHNRQNTHRPRGNQIN
nr:DUF4219 domain-containing protein [Tanacetum cinerariifolium]